MNTKYFIKLSPVIILLWASCKNPSKKGLVLPPIPVNVVSAVKAKAVYYDQFPGTVVALNSVELRSQVAGFITRIFFKEGEPVTKGQALYEIDRRKYESAYLQAEANLQSAQANLVRAQKDADRYHDLLNQDAVARQLVDNADATLQSSKSQVDAARAAVVSAKTDLDYSLIKAPFSGRIGISQVKLGTEVTPGTTLLNTISSEDPIAVDFAVDEQAIPRFAAMRDKPMIPGDSTFMMQFSDGTPYPYRGKLTVVDRGVDSQSGTITVRTQFPNPHRQLLPGMSCQLKVLNAQSGEHIMIPFKAITEQMGEFFVFVAMDTVAKQFKVRLGQRVNDNIVILDGINEGDKVITEGLNRLRDGGHIVLGAPKQATGTQQTGK